MIFWIIRSVSQTIAAWTPHDRHEWHRPQHKSSVLNSNMSINKDLELGLPPAAVIQ